MADNRGLLQVSGEQRGELESWAQSRSLPAGDVFRARLILALADGLSYREIERKLGRQRAHRVEMEETVRAGRHGRLTGPASRKQAATGNADHAGAGDSASTTETL